MMVIWTSLPAIAEEAILWASRVPNADIAVITGVTTSFHRRTQGGKSPNPQMLTCRGSECFAWITPDNFLCSLALPAELPLQTVMRTQYLVLRWKVIPLRAPIMSSDEFLPPSLRVSGCESEPFAACHLQRPGSHDQAISNTTAYFQGRLWVSHWFHSRVGHSHWVCIQSVKTLSPW